MKNLKASRQFVALGLGLAFLPALAAGCKKKSTPDGAASASASASAAPTAGLTPPPGADPDLFAKLAEIVEKCTVNVDDATTTCKGEETRRLGDDFAIAKRSRPEAVRTLALALSSSNEKLRAATASVMHAGFRNTWGADRKVGDVKPEDAKELIKATFALPKPYVRRALPGTVHAAILANVPAELFAQLDAKKEPEIAAVGYRYVMTHGRLSTFPKIQEIAKGDETRVTLAAIESVQQMDKWTDEEQAQICPWTVTFMSDKRPSIAARAASALNNCGTKYLDEILASSEKALKDGEFSSARLSGLRSMCTTSRKNQPNPPTEAQCNRSRALLEKVVQTPKLDVSTRSSALVALTNQWSDAKMMAFVKRLQAAKTEGLTEQLKTAVRRLENKDKSAAPGAAGSAAAPRRSAAPPAPAAKGNTPG
jgi:hypothetical protein